MNWVSKQEKRLTSLAADGAYRPLEQLLHPPDPFTMEMVPNEHAWHAVDLGSSLKYPGRHCTHPELLFPEL